MVEFDEDSCPIGSMAYACSGSTCTEQVQVIHCLMDEFNIVNVNIFGVPEFGAIGAAVALIGSAALVYRKRK